MRNYQFWYYIKMEMTTVALVNSFITILRNMYLRVIIKSFKIFRIFLFWQAIVAHYIIIGTIIKTDLTPTEQSILKVNYSTLHNDTFSLLH